MARVQIPRACAVDYTGLDAAMASQIPGNSLSVAEVQSYIRGYHAYIDMDSINRRNIAAAKGAR